MGEDFDQNKATNELQKMIDSIDFAGGLEETSTPVKAPSVPAASSESTSEPEAQPEPEPQDATKDQPKPEEPTDKTGDATPAIGGDKPADDLKVIPDSHFRAALHMGWKPEDIGELYDKSPEVALKTLAKCYEQVNATSRQLGELGQRSRQLREQPPQQPQTQQPSRKDTLLKKLKEKYEDDPIIDVLGELIPDQVSMPEQPRQRQSEPRYAPPSVDQEIAVRQQINTFFTADEMDIYGDFYGTTSQTGGWDTLTPGQRANRLEVCNRAQNILDGAAMAGMQVSTAEALERAHLEVTAPIAEQFVRERIVKSAQKRAAGVVLKPSGTKTPKQSGVYNKEQAIKNVSAEISKVFG